MGYLDKLRFIKNILLWCYRGERALLAGRQALEAAAGRIEARYGERVHDLRDNPFSHWEKVAPKGVERRPSFDGL
jgi:hypothetical protein